MKRKFTHFIRTCLFTLILLLASILPCHASGIGSGVAPDTPEDPSYLLEADRTQISFGALEQGGLLSGQKEDRPNRGSTQPQQLRCHANT